MPLWVVAKLEATLHEALAGTPSEETMVLVVFLCMLWGALRFSDIQRSASRDMCLADGVLRGNAWRTKSSKGGMPFGVICSGIYSDWSRGVQVLMAARAKCDFLLADAKGNCASYAQVLGWFRYLLVHKGGLSPEQAALYTLHSLKTTGLSWALQLEVPEPYKKAWGHHRGNSGERMVSLYGRDDVLPALRAQWRVLSCVREGWVPLTPQGRGGSMPAKEGPPQPAPPAPCQPPPGVGAWKMCAKGDSDTDTESETSSSSLSSSDEESCDDAAFAEDHQQAVVTKGFLLNRMSRCFHGVVSIGGEPRRACAPLRELEPRRWVFLEQDPCEQDGTFLPCGHTACAKLVGIV